MLIEFKVANYRSIREEQTLSMVASAADKELPQNLISCDHVPGLKGTKLVKAVALYGANASGKSNIVAALRFFAEFVRDSATKLQPGAPTGAQPFKLDPACLDQPSKFEINAVINGIRTLYGIEMTRERVTSEYLVAYPKGRPQVWFERDWDEEKGKYTWSKSTEHFKHDAALREKTRGNAAFVTVAAQFNQSEAKSISEWLTDRLVLTYARPQPLSALTARVFLEDPDMRSALLRIIGKVDLGVAEIRTRKVEQVEAAYEYLQWVVASGRERSEKLAASTLTESLDPTSLEKAASMFIMPEFLHKGVEGSLVPLHFEREESLGTQRFTALIADVLGVISSEQALLVDEIEMSLHPSLVRNMIALFLSPKLPSGNSAQLIFTTHNPLLLDQTLLRRDQIWFTEKDQEGATRLYPLTDFKPRKDESLVKGYLAGRYGGIPFIPEGLKS